MCFKRSYLHGFSDVYKCAWCRFVVWSSNLLDVSGKNNDQDTINFHHPIMNILDANLEATEFNRYTHCNTLSAWLPGPPNFELTSDGSSTTSATQCNYLRDNARPKIGLDHFLGAVIRGHHGLWCTRQSCWLQSKLARKLTDLTVWANFIVMACEWLVGSSGWSTVVVSFITILGLPVSWSEIFVFSIMLSTNGV